MMTGVAHRIVLYEQLGQLSLAIERVIPPHERETTHPPVWEPPRKFCPSTDMMLEAQPEGVWRLNIDPVHWQWHPPRSQVPQATRFSLRNQARLHTQHASAWEDQMRSSPPPPMPSGVRLWHANDAARRLLIHAKHDLRELFQTQTGFAHDESLTLLITPTRVLGYQDAITLIQGQSPYLTKICHEYGQMVCWLYGLRMDEFAALTQMCISRHVGSTTIDLQRNGGGYYDSGPMITIGIGHCFISHDFSPTLMDSEKHAETALTPVRVRVGEGIMTVMDAHARISYAHGYSREPDGGGGSPYYTIDFYMDCMRNTRITGYVKWTGDMIMHTPVMSAHTVQTRQIPMSGGTRVEGVCPLLDLIRTMRRRVQGEESACLLAIQNKKSHE